MTLAERLGIGVSNNVRLPVSRNWMTKQDTDFTIREMRCGRCNFILAVEVTEHPASVDLVWPHKVLCSEHGHILAERSKTADGIWEDANVVCVGRGATFDEAKLYLERYK